MPPPPATSQAPRSSPSPLAARPARAAALEQVVPEHHPPALPGRPLHRVRRRLHRPEPERRRAPRCRRYPPLLPLRRHAAGQHRRRLPLATGTSAAPTRPTSTTALLRADLRPAAAAPTPATAAGTFPRCPHPAGLALRRQHGRPDDLPGQRRPRLRRQPRRSRSSAAPAPSCSRPRPRSPSSTTTRSTPRTSGATATCSAPPTSGPRSRSGWRSPTTRRSPTTSRHRAHRPLFGGGPQSTQDTTDVDTPQSVQLDFQTGVAPKTLVFGYVRWVDWSEFSISPARLRAADRRPPRRSRGRSSTTPTTGGPTTSASAASSPTRSPARSRSPTSRASAAR